MPRPNELPLDYFDGAGNVSDREGLLRVLREMDDAIAAAPRSSGVEGVIHQLYADGENGSDSWVGDTPSTPKRTLGALATIVPDFIRDSVTLNLRNRLTLGGGFYGDIPSIGSVGFFNGSNALKTGAICIDGGSEVVEVAGPWVADIYAADRIGRSSLTLTPDQYTGRWLEVVDGPMAGRRMNIIKHDATTFYPPQPWTLDPGPATFRVVEPRTEIYGVPGAPQDYLVVGVGGDMRFRIQRLKITGEAFIATGRTGSFMAPQVIWNSTTHLNAFGVGEFAITGYGQDPLTGALLTGTEPGMCVAGLSVLSPATTMTIYNSHVHGLYGCVFKCNLALSCCTAAYILSNGTRILGKLTLESCLCRLPLVASQGVWRTAEISNAAGVGLHLIGCGKAKSPGALIISGCGSHAIELDNSDLELSGVVSGSGNAGAGCYPHNAGHLSFAAAAAPTVTGTVGDVSLDGTTQQSTWAAIAAGTPINGATPGNVEFAIVKKV